MIFCERLNNLTFCYKNNGRVKSVKKRLQLIAASYFVTIRLYSREIIFTTNICKTGVALPIVLSVYVTDNRKSLEEPDKSTTDIRAGFTRRFIATVCTRKKSDEHAEVTALAR